MKILSLFTSLLILTISSNVSAESFVEGSNIIQKKFSVASIPEGNECTIETKHYLLEEFFTTTSKPDGEKCDIYFEDIIKTESTRTNNGRIDAIINKPGIPEIIENMDVGSNWSHSFDFYFPDDETPSYNAIISFEVLSHEPISTPAGIFEKCAYIQQEFSLKQVEADNYSDPSTIYKWYCENVGLVLEKDVDGNIRKSLDKIKYMKNIGTKVFGKDYIQPNSITEKLFINTEAHENDTCPYVAKKLNGNAELHVSQDLTGDKTCSSIDIYNIITEDTYIFNGYNTSYGSFANYTPGIPMIIKEMEIGKVWEQKTELTTKFSWIEETSINDLTEKFLPLAIEDVDVPAGSFKSCLKIYRSSPLIYYWHCPNVGLVKQENIQNEYNLQLVDYSAELNADTVSGADYVQSDRITSKLFKDTLATQEECEIENRSYDGETEIRTKYPDEFSNTPCSEIPFFKNIRLFSASYTGFEYTDAAGTVFEHKYAPGIPVIIDTMSINQTWSETSDITKNDSEFGSRTDEFELLSIEDVNIAGHTFENCLKLGWESEETNDYGQSSQTSRLWMCSFIGMVKYQIMGDGKIFSSLELQSYEATNALPTISGYPDIDVTENEAYSFTPTVSDDNGDTLTFSIENKPSWASFDSGTGTLSGTPSAGDAGIYTDIIISVTDNGQEFTKLNPFSITVDDAVTIDPIDDGNGSSSGGGGNMPFVLLTVLGLITIKRKHK